MSKRSHTVLILSVTTDPNKNKWLRGLFCQNTNWKNVLAYIHALNRPSSMRLNKSQFTFQLLARALVREFDEEHTVPVSDVSNGPV